MLLILGAALLCLSHRDSLALCGAVFLIVVGSGYALPDPEDSAENWFLLCGLMELALVFMACRLKAPGAMTVAVLSCIAIGCHALGEVAYRTDAEWYYLYGPTIGAIEYTQILSCAIFSPPILRGARWLMFGRRRKGSHYDRRYKLA